VLEAAVVAVAGVEERLDLTEEKSYAELEDLCAGDEAELEARLDLFDLLNAAARVDDREAAGDVVEEEARGLAGTVGLDAVEDDEAALVVLREGGLLVGAEAGVALTFGRAGAGDAEAVAGLLARTVTGGVIAATDGASNG